MKPGLFPSPESQIQMILYPPRDWIFSRISLCLKLHGAIIISSFSRDAALFRSLKTIGKWENISLSRDSDESMGTSTGCGVNLDWFQLAGLFCKMIAEKSCCLAGF
jgi:hypothetical protein